MWNKQNKTKLHDEGASWMGLCLTGQDSKKAAGMDQGDDGSPTTRPQGEGAASTGQRSDWHGQAWESD